MARPLRTTDIARALGVHPNTVRLYEQWGFLPPIPRSPSGYRQFTPQHLEQMRLARIALQWPYPGGKAPVLEAVTSAAQGDLGRALEAAYRYLANVRAERAYAQAAVEFLDRWAHGQATDSPTEPLPIGQAAARLGVTVDMLRGWERSGLLSVPRDPANGYRRYGAAEIGRVRVIRMLRQAGYSTMAILRMLLVFDQGRTDNLGEVLDTPRRDEIEDEMLHAADQWLSALSAAEQRALDMIAQLAAMIAASFRR